MWTDSILAHQRRRSYKSIHPHRSKLFFVAKVDLALALLIKEKIPKCVVFLSFLNFKFFLKNLAKKREGVRFPLCQFPKLLLKIKFTVFWAFHILNFPASPIFFDVRVHVFSRLSKKVCDFNWSAFNIIRVIFVCSPYNIIYSLFFYIIITNLRDSNLVTHESRSRIFFLENFYHNNWICIFMLFTI